MAESYPKVVEHPDGRRKTVHNLHEQDEATKAEFLRSIARNRELREKEAQLKALNH